MRCFAIVLMVAVTVACAAAERVTMDARLLASLPERRHEALVRLAITVSDSSPAIGEKKSEYIAALKRMTSDLIAAYYWHSDLPADVDAAIEKRAVYLAGLAYPGSPTTGCSAYSDLIERYLVAMHEEQIVRIAQAVSERLREPDVVIVGGEALIYSNWKQAWDEAGRVKNGPNQTPEPTAMLVTPRAFARVAPSTAVAHL